jgi:LacI family transcriptional regulator
MVTIKEVAEKAGVSITTVSHVVNETRYVSDELTEKVYEAMRDLRYRPNIVARSLRSGQTKTIGLILPDISNPFFAEFSRKIEDKGFTFGYNVILCNADEDDAKQQRYIDVLLSKQVDGLIFFSTGYLDTINQTLDRYDIPVVITDREPEGVNSDIVLIDNRMGGYQAARYLLSLGHRRIACISGPSLIRPSAQRVGGYRAALEEAGVDVDEDLIRTGTFRFESGEAEMRQLMKLPDPPTAVFTCNDLMALGAMKAVQSAGLRVPEDFSIVGFDNSPLSKMVYPQLTTVSQPVTEMADLTVELLVEKINIKENQKRNKALKPEYKRVILDTRLIIRESCMSLNSEA